MDLEQVNSNTISDISYLPNELNYNIKYLFNNISSDNKKKLLISLLNIFIILYYHIVYFDICSNNIHSVINFPDTLTSMNLSNNLKSCTIEHNNHSNTIF